jgi:serine/threonine-protein kinase
VSTDLTGQLEAGLGDRYHIERELGQGGMAIVLLALDRKHQRHVAIKVLRPELSAALGPERFLREIEIAATLQHPHILPLFDSGQVDGLLYYVMPFVEGESLRGRLRREQQLPMETALQITREVGSALQYAHDHGVIHRDIKPENIMLSGGHAVVADFGIARALDAAGAGQITQSGMVVGTPQYMSPEQAGGAFVEGRCDQYSLACTLYEMLIGQPPFTGPSSQAVMARHSLEPVPSLRIVRQAVSPSVEAAIVRAMAKLPVDRFPSVDGFIQALDQPVPRAKASRTHQLTLAALAIAAFLILASLWSDKGRTVSGGATPSVRSVAVLPFRVGGDTTNGSYLGTAITEGLIADLAQVGSLRVISRGSGTVAQEMSPSLSALARELHVEGVVSGSIERTGDSVLLDVRFLRADSTPLLSRSWQGPIGALPDLQREITLALTSSINAQLRGEEKTRLDTRRMVDQRAYDSYLKGRFHLEQGDLEQAKTFFEQASSIAPDWAPPFVGLASYYTSLPFSTDIPPARVLPEARKALASALALDETLAEAHATNAYIRAYFEWDWREAEKEFRRALELRPNYADAYFSYSRFLASRRRLDEAIAQLGHAVELDPLSLELQANRALLDYFAGRYPEAEKRLSEILARDSSDVLAQWGLALVLEQERRFDSAIAILERVSGASANRRASLGHAYAMAGKTAKARAILAGLKADAEKRYVPAYWFALIHEGLGEREQALRQLERAYEERSTVLSYLLIDPRLATLRLEPRYLALARQLGAE